jgi:hypothetical protein
VGPSNAGPALQALFSGHDSDSGDCRLLDLLMHADLLASATSAPIAFAPPQNRAVVHIGSHHAAQAAGPPARGPPAGACGRRPGPGRRAFPRTPPCCPTYQRAVGVR